MNRDKIHSLIVRRLHPVIRFAAVAIFLSLPITSMPLLSRVLGNTLVAPPSVLFLFFLLLGWLPVFLLRRDSMPAETYPLLVFIIIAIISSALAFFLPLPPYKGNSILGEEIRAMLTLAIGAAFYIATSTWFRDLNKLTGALRLINISGFLIVAWSLSQLYIILVENGHYPLWMDRVQQLLSVRSILDPVSKTRLVGFTYEPSWLANQLNTLYLPFWLAATLSGYSAFKKVWKISLENFLLVSGLVVLVFSYSRIGLLAFLLVLAYAILRLHSFAIRWAQSRVSQRWKILTRMSPLHQRLMTVLTLLIYGLLIFLLLSFVARTDYRVQKLLALEEIPTNFYEFAFKVDFAERVVYWTNGWSVFARYPLLGVGLGNAGFFFREHLPNLAFRLNEILTLIDQAPYVPNTKSIWARLPAETGIVGMACFIAWLYVLWRAGRWLETKHQPLRVLGWMGTFSIIAYLAEGFSVDSFALPYIWVSLGLVTAASAAARRQVEASDSESVHEETRPLSTSF
ncbi:MAG: O-antigen ligase family protein [Chloroflexota bacterium]